MKTTVPPTPQNRFDPGYECELPESFFLNPNRGRPNNVSNSKPYRPKPIRLPAWLLVAVAALLLAAVVIWSTSGRKPVHERVSVPEPIATPTAVIPRSAPAPRAVLMRLPPPKAQLIRLPQWRIGEERLLTMPYGIQTLGTLRGWVPSPDRLPANGQLGDVWITTDNTAYVWLVAPNSASAQWIDP